MVPLLISVFDSLTNTCIFTEEHQNIYWNPDKWDIWIYFIKFGPRPLKNTFNSICQEVSLTNYITFISATSKFSLIPYFQVCSPVCYAGVETERSEIAHITFLNIGTSFAIFSCAEGLAKILAVGFTNSVPILRKLSHCPTYVL